MPSKPRKTGSLAESRALRAAMRSGQDNARNLLEIRARKRKARSAAVRRHVQAERTRRGAKAPITRNSTGTLVAEGDSWFDYPFYDVLKDLEDEYGYEVHSVAHRGDAVELMAYGGGQLDDLARCVERVLRNGTPPKAILLSGGGNDVAGDAFAMLVNHRASPNPGLNPLILDGLLRQRIRLAYATILSAVTQFCIGYLGRPVPILVHGYAYPVPDGRGFLGGWGPLPGPWLEPGFREKGYDRLGERVAIAARLIDAFNTMIRNVTSLPEYGHVHYIDLRPTLSNDLSNYKRSWGNELHPTESGFKAVTARFSAVLSSLP